MSITHVQGKANGALDSTVVVTLDDPPAAGNLIVVGFNDGPATCDVSSISDTAGNTYHAAGAIQRGTDDNCAIWYAYNVATADPFTVTVTVANRGFPSVCVQEWSGISGAADPLDGEAGAEGNTTGAGNDFAVGPLTPSDAASLAVLVINDFGYDARPADLDHWVGFGYDYLYGGALASGDPYAPTFSFSSESYHVAKMALFRAPYTNWVDIPDFEVRDIDFGQYPGGAARVVCSLFSAVSSISLQARLYDITNAASLGESAAVYGTDDTDATFGVTSSGVRRCKLQMTAGTPHTDVGCAPGAEVTA